ncbi:MAG: B12-binding domain-containing radical SAM protein [Omnitrophica bacterium]|nr:B12-binding domain-containing radical SAM protein [Candidatus Omnitrophota bacterium]
MQGSARLYAYLKKEGHDIEFKDLNQDIYFTMLSKEYLGETFEKARSMIFSITRDKFLRRDMGSILVNNSSGAIKRLLAGNSGFIRKLFRAMAGLKITNSNIIYELFANRDFVISEIDKARKILDEEFLRLSPEEFLTHFQTLLCGKAIVDTVYFPSELDFGLGFQGTSYRPHTKDIINAVRDERHNYLIPYYRKKVVPLLEKERPSVVGISITHTSEFVPAFTLARLIKTEYPETHVCLGGATATEVVHRIRNNRPLWDFFDSVITGPGERAFSELIEHVETRKPLSEVPNLLYKDKGGIKKSLKSHRFDINDACTPEYVSVRPGSILPLETSSGCYWGKCIFCYYPKEGLADIGDTENVRIRRIDLVLEDMRKLRDKYDPSYISITDSSLHPKRIEKLARWNLENEKKMNFSAFIRFEKEFTSREFCAKLAEGGFLGGQAGLETGSNRVNRIINKGVDLDEVKIILRNFYETGILIHLYTIVGVPGERRKETRLTYDFIKKYHRMLTLDWQIYSLRILEHGPLAKTGEKFGLKTQALPGEFLAQLMRYRLKEGLSEEESMKLSIRFNEGLKGYLHPLQDIMDTEMCKVFLLAQKTKKIPPNKIKI